MTYASLARQFDAKDDPVQAAWLYEIALQDPEPTIDVYLDLAVLYFTCCDTGYAHAHRLDQAFVDVAFDRAIEVLDLADRRFGPQPESRFWRLYVRQHVIAEDVGRDAYVKLAFETNAPIAYLGAFVETNGHEFAPQARALFDRSRLGRTARERYVRSVTERAMSPTP